MLPKHEKRVRFPPPAPIPKQNKKMKTSKQLFVIIALLGASFAFAAETKPAAPAGKKGGCCVKAETAGAACAHPCCVESAKAGKNCEKCGGTNVAATKK